LPRGRFQETQKELILCGAGCSSKSDPQAEAPPPLKVERVEDRNVFEVERPERFKLTMAVEHVAAPELRVTGTVNPDILRAQPVISLAMGRVVEIDAKLGDTVQKGIGVPFWVLITVFSRS
jgi:membrane fusion protein, heavy metal efflux system